jgi:cytochrome c-type biogenesis protein CcmH/NrfF
LLPSGVGVPQFAETAATFSARSGLDNLELQPWEEAKRKDRIEVKLQCLVCAGQVALADAQREILEDWQAAYHQFVG